MHLYSVDTSQELCLGTIVNMSHAKDALILGNLYE